MALAFAALCIRTGPAWLAKKIEADRAKYNEREGDWTRLREEIHRLNQRLNEEIERARVEREAQEQENRRCRHELAVISAKLGQEVTERIKLQAILDGMGEIRQAAANASAEVRLDAIDKQKKGDGNG